MDQKQIVLVEDDAQLQSILAKTLTRLGHAVHAVRLGADARQLLASCAADVLLLDINLPDETGWDVLRWLRSQTWPQPRVVVLTAVRPPPQRVERLRPDAVLTKPFPIDALTRLIENGTKGAE